MSVIEDHRKNGGFWGCIHKLAQNLINKSEAESLSSLNRLINNDDYDAQAQEIKMILDNKDHPMHHFIYSSLMSQLISEVANDAESLSYDQLINKYGDGYFVDIGITRAEIHRKKEIDRQNGKLSRDKRFAESEIVKNEAIRLYQSDEKLWTIHATNVEAKIHKDLIAFIKETGLKKKDYVARTIEGWIRAERNKINITVEGG